MKRRLYIITALAVLIGMGAAPDHAAAQRGADRRRMAQLCGRYRQHEISPLDQIDRENFADLEVRGAGSRPTRM